MDGNETRGETELHDIELSLEHFIRAPRDPDGSQPVTIVTTRGDIALRYYAAKGDSSSLRPGAIFCGSIDGDDATVAERLYPKTCAALAEAGVACAAVTFRRASDFHECVLDVLGTMAFLDEEDAAPVALIAHSLATAVAVQVALLSPDVAACALLSAVPFEDVEEFLPHLGPRRAVLFVHGTADTLVPVTDVRALFSETSEPKRLLAVPEAGHDLRASDDDDGSALATELSHWINSALRRPEAVAD